MKSQMNTIQTQTRRPTWALLLAAALACSAALAASHRIAPDAHARYQRERAACAGIQVHDARANCLSEASTRFASTQPAAVDMDPGRYTRNALKRCEPLAEADRRDCVARMNGHGTTTGSVESGGIYRELVTISPALPEAAQPAKAAP